MNLSQLLFIVCSVGDGGVERRWVAPDYGFENYGPAGNMFLEKILPAMPAKRFASPEEIASAVVRLSSKGAPYVTGSVVSVDGGLAYHFLPLIDIEDTTKAKL